MSPSRRCSSTYVALFLLAIFVGMDRNALVRAQGAPAPATVSGLIAAGRYADAEATAERLYRERDTASDAGDAAEVLVAALVHNGRGAETRTRELAESVVRGRASAGSAQPNLLARALASLAEVLFQAGDYRLAVLKFREALALRENTLDTSSPEIATSLEDLAQALTEPLAADSASAEEALTLINRALTLRQATGVATDTARAHEIRGVLWQSSGNFARAREDLEAAATLQHGMHPTHPDTAAVLVHLGEEFAFEGALGEAHATLEHACAMAETTLRSEHPDIANCLRSLTMVDEELGDLSGAKRRRERALAITEASLGADHPKFAVQLNDLANNFLLQGDFSTARTLYERARSVYERRLGVDSNAAIVVTFNLGLLHTRLGGYGDARRELDRTIKTWTRILGPEHPNVARALSALAELLADQGLHAQARVFYAQALRIRERALGAEHPYVARTLSNLASTMSQLQRRPEALALSNRALRIWEQSGVREGLAEALVTHAEILSRNGDQEGAAAAYRRALDMRIALFGPSHPLIGETELALASVELRTGDANDAFERALRGERIGREHARLTLGYLAEREALDYVARLQSGVDVAVSLADNAPGRVFDEVIRGRSLALDEIGGRRRLVAEAQGAEANVLWTNVRTARQRLANLLVRGPGNAAPDQYSATLEAARAQKDAAERALAERSATFRTNVRNVEVGLTEVRRALPGGAALVAFVRYNDSRTAVIGHTADRARNYALTASPAYVAFVMRSDEREPTVVRLGNAAAIEAAIVAWRTELTAGLLATSGGPMAAERALRGPGSRLRRRIWDPIATHLADVSHVFVVPDSAINLVPFAALPEVNGGYLLERGPVIHYLSAERDLATAYARQDDDVGNGLLVVGGPTFTSRVPFATSGAQNSSANAHAGPNVAFSTSSGSGHAAVSSGLRGASSGCATFQNMHFSTLPAAAHEAEDVAALWQGMGSARDRASITRLIGAAATESAVKQLGPGHRVLHLATHGFFLGDECASLEGTRAVGAVVSSVRPPAARAARRTALVPENPLVLSGLAFAGANLRALAKANQDDGILTAEEVASLDLTGVEWAVLSACDTGRGLIRAGEGVLGLRRAFQVAGAHTVIMSLWPVEDQAARRWMQTVYRSRLDGRRSTADAVRDAALAVLRERRTHGLSGHPFYWAGFVAAGDWR